MKSVEDRWRAARAVEVTVTDTGIVKAKGLLCILKGLSARTNITQLGLYDEYPSIDDLPMWVKERVIKLSMVPTLVLVDNIGKRGDYGVYYIWAPEDL